MPDPLSRGSGPLEPGKGEKSDLVLVTEHAERLAKVLEEARESATWEALPLLVRANANRAVRLFREREVVQ